MFRQYQYDIFTEPPTTLPENVTADRWAQPQSQPIPNNFAKKAAGYAVALIAATGLFWGVFTPTTVTPSNAGGISGKSTCITVKRSYAATSPSFFWGEFTPAVAPAAPNFSWTPNYPDQILKKKSLTAACDASDGQSTSGAVFSPEIVTADRWAQPQSQPYPYKKALLEAIDVSDGQAPIGLVPLPVGPITTGTDSPEYIFFKFGTPLSCYQHVFWSGFTPSGLTPTDWLGQQNQPVQAKRSLPVSEQQALFPRYPTTTPDTWYPGVEQPVQIKKTLHASLQQASVTAISIAQETVSEDKWHHSTSQPYPSRKSLLTAQQLAFFWPVSTAQENVTVDNFAQPQSQPVQTKKNLLTANQQASFAYISTSQEAEGWQQSINQPQPVRRIAQQQAFFWGAFTPATEVIFTNWLPSYQDKIAPKNSLHASQQQATFWNVSIAQEVVSEDKWHNQTSQPFPKKQSLATAEQLAFFFGRPTAVEYLTDSTLQSQPVAAKKHTRTDAISFVADPTTQVSVVLQEQVKTRFNTALYQPVSLWPTQPTSTVLLDWQQPQSQPTPSRKVVVTEAAVWNISTQPEVTTEDRWHHTQSQPYPSKKSLLTAQQQATFWSTFTPPDTVFPSHWHAEYPQPFPKKLYLATANEQANFWNTSTSPEASTEDRWHQPVSQPYPYKPYRPASLYPYTFYDPSFAPEVVSLDKWQQPQSQPTPKPYPRAVYETIAWAPFTPAAQTATDWLTQTNQPARRNLRATITETPFVQIADEGWQNQQFVPQRRAPVPQQLSFVWGAFTPQQVNLDWQQQTQQPIIRKNSLQQQAFSWSGFTPVAAVATDWLAQTQQPSNRKNVAQQQAFFWSEFTPVVQTSTDWIAQQNQPTRRLLTAQQQSFFYGNFTPVVLLDWQQPTNQPVQSARKLGAADRQASFWHISTQQETVFVSSWVQPQSQPKLTERYRRACYDWIPWIPFTPGTQGSIEWIQPIDQPYPYKHVVKTAQQQAFFWHISLEKEAVVVSSWVQPVSQPYPYEKHLATAQQLAFTWHISLQQENVLSSSWQPLIEQPYPYRKFLQNDKQLASIWNTDTPPAVVPDFVIGTGQVTQVIFAQGNASSNIIASGSSTQIVIGRGKTG